MPNCKPGDLAVVIACPTCPRNVGRFVTVVQLATEDWRRANGYPYPKRSDELCWVVRPQDGVSLDVVYTSLFIGSWVAPSSTPEVSMSDLLLQPIRPPGQTQDTPTSVSDCQPRWVVAPDNQLAKDLAHENV